MSHIPDQAKQLLEQLKAPTVENQQNVLAVLETCHNAEQINSLLDRYERFFDSAQQNIASVKQKAREVEFEFMTLCDYKIAPEIVYFVMKILKTDEDRVMFLSLIPSRVFVTGQLVKINVQGNKDQSSEESDVSQVDNDRSAEPKKKRGRPTSTDAANSAKKRQ